ncbi:MAG: lysine-arginine-ornithine-binding periplasmic protein [Phenylobacterium sp.]|uniref:amino acid ABC transporter substrate-binding protein n=1 Tax=Phenylobacterium sp. TaxID=1871053 RepID=UPI00261A4069|nr:amino acid ABC transporter substrate-binding protein [Phenylobacterium sp.]MDB5426699.1 lysine-arginine-ornithine-binding periplasmic protein [Phenylobacterium sp.]MDB5498108.1 lysine-arginine-ornithine-binding periplasmic protein [Phenylobacterium sp.]
MIRRLAAAAFLILGLAGCGGGSNPPPAPTPAGKAPAPISTRYKATPSKVLNAVRKRGYLACGVNPGLPGFAYPDVRGVWRGFDVDFCRAVAAAVLGDANKVRFTPISALDRFSALQKGQIDLLSRNTSWSFSRDAGLGLDFAAITYFDGQGFLAPKALGLTSAQELSGARICVQAGTVTVDNLADFFRARGLTYKPVVVASEAEARRLYENDGCDVFTADISALAGSRSVLNNPGAHVILPDVISKEPLGPVVRQNDPVWADIVRWTVYATVLGEELGLTSKTVAQARETASDPQTRRLLGVEGDYGAMLGLPRDWAYQVIRQVGAYHEIFDRDVGARSPLKLDRGLNALWSAPKPGLLYAPPMR